MILCTQIKLGSCYGFWFLWVLNWVEYIAMKISAIFFLVFGFVFAKANNRQKRLGM